MVKNDLIVVVDQAFEEPVFDGIEMVTIAALPGMWERTACTYFQGMEPQWIKSWLYCRRRCHYGQNVRHRRFCHGATSTSAQMGSHCGAEGLRVYGSILRPLTETQIVYEHLHDIPGVSMKVYQNPAFVLWTSKLVIESEITKFENTRRFPLIWPALWRKRKRAYPHCARRIW